MMRLLRYSSPLVFIFLWACSCSKDPLPPEPTPDPVDSTGNQVATFNNPLLTRGPDPWVYYQDSTYYYTHTTGNNLQIWSTRFMEDLGTAIPRTIWQPGQTPQATHDIWAPELFFLDGKWYLYFAATYDDESPNSVDENRRMFVLENESASPLQANWVFKGKIADATDLWAIDGTVMEWEGQRYFIWSGWRTGSFANNTGRQQLYIAKMTNPWTLEGNRVMISEPLLGWERNGLVNEGPVAWENPDGDMFLFYSASGCWTDDYAIGVLSLAPGADPLDPASWTKNPEPVFQKEPLRGIFGPGHNSFFKSPDGTEDWILYHANDNPGDGCTDRRKPRIQKIAWDDNGFPDFGMPVANTTDQAVPAK